MVGLKAKIADETLENVVAVTGIPSMESQYKTLYPATIDKLISGMKRSKNYAYMVVADPIDANEVDEMLFQCREMNGQAESLKSMNVTEGISKGENHSTTSSTSTSVSNSISESISKKDFSKLGKAAMTATGLGVAASFFPAAGAVFEGCVTAAGALTSAAVGIMGGSMAGNLISGLMPQKTSSTSTTNTSSQSQSETIGTTESKSESISRNIVSKHIEAVSEHLFYHSKRLETGKAIGLWKVGIYMMSEKKSDIDSGALQLRSILSGQESIYEPIRIHDISSLLDKDSERNHTLRELTLGMLSAPTIAINTMKGKRFDHPLGDHYKELKTVLTTKELSYLINFPMRSVPGINVVECAPDFSLKKRIFANGANSFTLGKYIYGGSVSDIDFDIDANSFCSHTLVTGIRDSGKTNTVMSILENLKELPFLVLEAEKTDYIEWAINYNQVHPEHPIRIFMPGCKQYHNSNGIEVTPEKLLLNPFDIGGDTSDFDSRIISHIDRIKVSFASLFSDNDMLPMLLEEVLFATYRNALSQGQNESNIYPTLSTLIETIPSAINGYGLSEHQKSILNVTIATRIKNLIRGWKGELINSPNSNASSLLCNTPTVINLSCLSDNAEKKFIISLILINLFEMRQTTQLKELSHVTVIENASRIFEKQHNHNSTMDSRRSLFNEIVSSLGQKGEGLILVDPNPSNIMDEVVRNIGTKISHKLIFAEDCTEMCSYMGLKKEQMPLVSKLAQGQCIVTMSTTSEKFWIEVNKAQYE